MHPNWPVRLRAIHNSFVNITVRTLCVVFFFFLPSVHILTTSVTLYSLHTPYIVQYIQQYKEVNKYRITFIHIYTNIQPGNTIVRLSTY